MENKNIHHDQRITIDSNPANSVLLQKSIEYILTDSNPVQAAFDTVDESISMFYSGTTLNTFDVPCYLAALDIMRQSLMTLCDERDLEMYNKLKEHSVVNTFHMNHEEDTDNEDT